jgi:TRAP-type transport system small permease protein
MYFRSTAASPPPAGDVSLRARVLTVQRDLALVMQWVEYVIVAISAVLLVFLVVALFLQVVSRYVIQQPLPWTEEGGRFALVWYAMLAASLAARKGQQFVFRWATLPLPNIVRLWLRQLVNVLTLAFLTVIFVQSVGYLSVVADQTATATRVNMRIPYAGLCAGFGFLIIVYFFDSLDALCSIVTKQTFSPREREELIMHSMLSAGGPGERALDDELLARP